VPKPVRLRRLAAEDIDAAVDHYLREAGHDIAGRFIDAVERP
jgi:plasmid stabilization system protein ParE